MAEGDGQAYNAFKKNLMDGVHDLDTGGNEIKLILVSAYTIDIDGDVVYTDVSGVEYGAGSGYTVGGEIVGGQGTVQNNTLNRGEWDANDVIWAALGALSPATPSHCIMYDNTPSTPLDPLMAVWVIGTTATTGGNYAIEWDVLGIFLLA